MTTAALCRANGWGPGTALVGDEGFGPAAVLVTAVGEAAILARLFAAAAGGAWVRVPSGEGPWDLTRGRWGVPDAKVAAALAGLRV